MGVSLTGEQMTEEEMMAAAYVLAFEYRHNTEPNGEGGEQGHHIR